MAQSAERVRIAHLLRRAGFGASKEELNEYLEVGFDAAVHRLVNYQSQPESQPEPIGPAPSDLVGLQLRWLERMLHTRRPLQEKMTLF